MYKKKYLQQALKRYVTEQKFPKTTIFKKNISQIIGNNVIKI